jgi:hypothetical protein
VLTKRVVGLRWAKYLVLIFVRILATISILSDLWYTGASEKSKVLCFQLGCQTSSITLFSLLSHVDVSSLLFNGNMDGPVYVKETWHIFKDESIPSRSKKKVPSSRGEGARLPVQKKRNALLEEQNWWPIPLKVELHTISNKFDHAHRRGGRVGPRRC